MHSILLKNKIIFTLSCGAIIGPTMQRKAIPLLASFSIALLCAPSGQCAQNKSKSIRPTDPRLTFSFAIQPGDKPFRFTVQLKYDGTIDGVAIYRDGQTKAFQNLPSCAEFPDQVDENWGWGDLSKLIAHADLNFDGFQDLELIQNYIPHLDKRGYCIYLWDAKAEQFVFSEDLAGIGANPEAHPESKTLTTREDWMGGPWEESTYRWNGGKLELIEQNGLYGDWSIKPTDGSCSFTYTCSRLIEGKMVTTLEKPVCTPEEMGNLPDCPSLSTPKPPFAGGQSSKRQ